MAKRKNWKNPNFKPKSSKEIKAQKFEAITEQLINALDMQIIPWNKPYVVNLPKNVVTGREYRGMNFFLLDLMQQVGHPMASELNCYATMKQINDLGGRVKKGAKALPVTFMKKSIYTKEIECEDGEIEKEERAVWLIKSYNVFPIEAVTGIEWQQIVDPSEFEHDPIECEENIKNDFNALIDLGEIKFNIRNTIPNYNLGNDFVTMPEKKQFKSASEYYSTLFHELIHATGAKNRTDRFSTYKDFKFDSNKHEYSFEELVAEMGAAMLCAHYGIPSHKSIENSKAYIQSWAKVLKNDKSMAYMAASKAQQAVDYLLNKINETKAASKIAA